MHRYKSGFIFSDSTVAACFNGIQAGATLVDHFTFKDLTITGPGKAAGSSVHGVAIYNSAADSDNPFDINFENVLIEKLSGHAIYIPKLWNSTIRKVRCDAIGGSGIVVGANPAVLIEGSDYHDDIDGAAIWVIDGKPVLLNNNIGDVLQGMKFGRTATDFASPYNTATYAYPTIIGANIEGIRANGEGIYFNSGSFPHHLSNVMIYTGSGVTVDYGIY
ncbi:MAG: hypothetical protein GWN62_02295, partial [Aliifodinibius sp.]|nr:hypothetical protein [Fodinibius sp.]